MSTNNNYNLTEPPIYLENRRVNGEGNPCLGRPIQIDPVANGFIVIVGCQRFVFNSLTQMLDNIQKYYTEPLEVEQRYNEEGCSILV